MALRIHDPSFVMLRTLMQPLLSNLLPVFQCCHLTFLHSYSFVVSQHTVVGILVQYNHMAAGTAAEGIVDMAVVDIVDKAVGGTVGMVAVGTVGKPAEGRLLVAGGKQRAAAGDTPVVACKVGEGQLEETLLVVQDMVLIHLTDHQNQCSALMELGCTGVVLMREGRWTLGAYCLKNYWDAFLPPAASEQGLEALDKLHSSIHVSHCCPDRGTRKL